MGEETLPDKILKDLLETGFPVEIGTAETLKSMGWNVTHQAYHETPTGGNPRSTDLLATKRASVIHGEHSQDVYHQNIESQLSSMRSIFESCERKTVPS